MCTDINRSICQPITAVGQNNWTGSFISPDIAYIERETTIGGNKPTKIVQKNGKIVFFDGKEYYMDDKKTDVEYRIRKLTPRECLRLMSVDDEDIDKILAVNSNTQAYKQAGNSIVVDVMCRMFEKLIG